MTGETVSILYEAKEVCNLRWWRGYWEAANVSILYEANEVCNEAFPSSFTSSLRFQSSTRLTRFATAASAAW